MKATAEEMVAKAQLEAGRGQIEAAIAILEKAVKVHPKSARAWLRLGFFLHRAGKLDRAMKVHKKAATFPINAGISNYNIACVHALQGRPDDAFAALRTAVTSGFATEGYIRHMSHDKDLATLRDDPRFAKILELARATLKKRMRNVAVLIWDGVELLDFAGPSETFSVARSAQGHGFKVYTVAASKQPITSQGFVKVTPNHSIEDAPKPHIIVIPGGGTGRASRDGNLMAWIKKNAADAEIVMSVCTGAMLLCRLGLLDGLKATTHHGSIAVLRREATKTEILTGVRFVDNGKIITTAGVSAGIDGAMHVIDRLFGRDAAKQTAHYMQYRWIPVVKAEKAGARPMR